MSRTPSDAELVAIADRLDWWMPNWPDVQRMRTLREAIDAAMGREDFERVTLFRAGGFGAPAVWLNAGDIRRLADLFRNAAAA
jgi:hypothetical protein